MRPQYTGQCAKCGNPFVSTNKKQRFCSKRCARATRIYPPVEARFWAKVDKAAGPDGCWLWTGSRGEHGHGSFHHRPNSKTTASRYSWELAHGAIPDGVFVLHHCPGGDNASCVNPAHLHLGTQADNMREMQERRRGAIGPKNGAHTHPESVNRGEGHYKARLTAKEVIVIRQRYAAGERQAPLASEYGISVYHVGNIVRRKTWRHIE